MAKPTATYQKLRGGYYTPKPIADFLTSWAIQQPTATVLEPSCGDGNLLESAAGRLIDLGATGKKISQLLHGVEIDAQELGKAVSRLQALGLPLLPAQIEKGDFFSHCQRYLSEKRTFDAVTGNPPFVRYQFFPEEQRVPAFRLMQEAGLHPNKLTNSWVPFLVASTLVLSKKGRIGMVIPAELLQVNYAAELRQFISDNYSKVTLITFERLVFDGIQQEVILFLGERNGTERTGIRTIELEDMSDLASYQHTEFVDSGLKPLDHTTEKWTQYFLSKKEIELIRELRTNKALTLAGKVIDVDVGVVTGLNEFFVLTENQIKSLSLNGYTQPIVSRSGHLPGVIFTEADWKSNAARQLPAYLLNAPDVSFDDLPEALKKYVATGQRAGMNKGYKCSIRNPWYIVPSVWTPPAFMLRQIHNYPKIVVNKTIATCTDTVHRVKLLNGTSVQRIASAFLNSLTFAFAECLGRSYGGGVLELEPKEVDRLPIPLAWANRLNLSGLHKLVLADDIDLTLDLTDRVLLIDGLGLSRTDAKAIRGIWKKLRDRRINRKHSRNRRPVP